MIRKARLRLGRIYRDILAPLHYRTSRAELWRLLPSNFSTEALWNVCRGYKGRGWFRDLDAWQVESEYCTMVEWVARLQPRVILEIGTAKGATLLAWARIASELVVSVDLPGGIHGGGYVAHKEKLFHDFTHGRAKTKMLLFCGDSHSVELRDRVQAGMAGRSIDFLFIDGDHTYDGVARDFELWKPLVTHGGYVAFHDILPHRYLNDCQVDRLWIDLKNRYASFEIIADPDQGWAGIGILQIP